MFLVVQRMVQSRFHPGTGQLGELPDENSGVGSLILTHLYDFFMRGMMQ